MTEGMMITLKVHRDPDPATVNEVIPFRVVVAIEMPGELRLFDQDGNGFSRGPRRTPHFDLMNVLSS